MEEKKVKDKFNIKDVLYDMECMENRCHIDKVHNEKRITSFCILDALIDKCLAGEGCPNIEESYHKYLIDISLEGYVNLRSYYYEVDGIGKDDIDRYMAALNRIGKIINCSRVCKLNRQIFVDKSKEISVDYRVGCGIRNRKAYWNYMKHEGFNNPVTDYEGACSVIQNIHEPLVNGHDKRKSEGIAAKIRKYVERNMHIVNGFELFQLCLFRDAK